MTSNDAEQYNIAAIRQLLLAAFTPEDLRRFCYDRPTFRPVVDEFSPNHGLADMVDEVITYCESRLLWHDLLTEIKKENPRQYGLFEPHLQAPRHLNYTTTGAVCAPPGFQSQTAGTLPQAALMNGYFDSPPDPGETLEGKVRIRGWVSVQGSTMKVIQIWIDGALRGNATYGIPRPDAGGDFGFYWDWDTTQYEEGEHLVEVRATAADGTSTLIPSAITERLSIPFNVRNWDDG